MLRKLALAAVQVVQRFCHYILSRKTIVISHCNPMQHILTRQLLGGKYSKWIVILQEFDLEFDRATSKKSLVFAELICDFPHTATERGSSSIRYLTSHFSLSVPTIFGTEISLSISKLKLFGLRCPVPNAVVFVIKCVITLSLVILFTVKALNPYVSALFDF
jgi:hypothetical protein